MQYMPHGEKQVKHLENNRLGSSPPLKKTNRTSIYFLFSNMTFIKTKTKQNKKEAYQIINA
jgi:hypothetical protein